AVSIARLTRAACASLLLKRFEDIFPPWELGTDRASEYPFASVARWLKPDENPVHEWPARECPVLERKDRGVVESYGKKLRMHKRFQQNELSFTAQIPRTGVNGGKTDRQSTQQKSKDCEQQNHLRRQGIRSA